MSLEVSSHEEGTKEESEDSPEFVGVGKFLKMLLMQFSQWMSSKEQS
jgi:hypothetical protein